WKRGPGPTTAATSALGWRCWRATLSSCRRATGATAMTATLRSDMVVMGEVVEDGPALVLAAEQAYVTETATGLTFAVDTPLNVWAGVVTRLTRQHKRIEWAIGDAINFGEQ